VLIVLGFYFGVLKMATAGGSVLTAGHASSRPNLIRSPRYTSA
jgi:hypothetical protein